MIINKEQRSGKLIISYVNEEGTTSYMKINVPTQHQYSWMYSRQKSKGHPDFISWDGKPVYKVPSEFLSHTRLQEFFIDAGDKLTNPLFKNNTPQAHFCDIEVNVDDDGFPEPADAKNTINLISWSKYPDITVFGLKHLTGEQINNIEKDINNHLKKLGKEYKLIYKEYQNEADMLYDFLYNYARHATLISGWNFWAFDWQYIYNRCQRLNLDISWMSPTRQWYKHKIMERNKRVFIMLPQHKLIVDYLEIYKKWDRTIEVKENNTLDFVAEAALGIKKVPYKGTFKELYAKDFDRYVFYGAVDPILVEESHNKLKTMGTFLGLSNLTRVEAMQAFSPISMLTATCARYAYEKHHVFPKSNFEKKRADYEGAFVFEPTPDLYPWVASFDFASLYPSIMRQWKISIENFIKKDKSYTPKENEIKCSSGAIFDSSYDPLLPTILTDYYNKRKEAKKISFKAENESDKLKQILNKRKKEVNKSLN